MSANMENNTLRLIRLYMRTTLRSWFQYRVDALLRSVAVFLREGAGIIAIYFTLLKFDRLNGWNLQEMMFLYSLLFLTYGILIIFFTGLRDFGAMVRTGKFDRYILRPRGLLFQMIFVNADWFAAVGHGGLGIVLFVSTAGRVGIRWSPGTIVYYVLAVAGGVLIQGAIFLFLATLNIFLLETGSLKELLYYDTRKFAGYPISIFHRAIQCLMIYVVPMAFVNYFPAQFLLRKPDMAAFPEYFIYMTPLVGAVTYLLAYLFWRFGLRYYKSSGN